MAVKLRVTVPNFFLDVCDATNEVMEDRIAIYGFLGNWKDPSYLVVKVAGHPWIVSMEEVKEVVVDYADYNDPPGAQLANAMDLEDGTCEVYFYYQGNNAAFLKAAVDWFNSEAYPGGA